MNIPNHSTPIRTPRLLSSHSFTLPTFPPTLALQNPSFSASPSVSPFGLLRNSLQAMARKRPQRYGVQRYCGLMQTSKMQSLKVYKAQRVMGYFCLCCSVQIRLMVQEQAIRPTAIKKESSRLLRYTNSSTKLITKNCIQICRQNPQGMHIVFPLLTKLSMNSSERHMLFLHRSVYSSFSTHFGPLRRCRNTQVQKASVSKQAGMILSSFLNKARGYFRGWFSGICVNLQARKKPLRKKKMSVASSVVSTRSANGRYSTKFRVMTFTAPTTLLKKQSPITIHIIVSARTPFSTDSPLFCPLTTAPIFYCKRKPFSQFSFLRVNEATPTNRTNKISTETVRQKSQLQSNWIF